MRNKWFAVFCALLFTVANVWAAVDVNTANEVALQQVKGIGASKATAIVAERNAHGPFKDAADLAARVKGFGQKSVAKLTAGGLTIGASKGGAPQKSDPAKGAQGGK